MAEVLLPSVNVDVSRQKWPCVDRALTTIRIGLLGYGRIGQAVLRLASLEGESLASAGVEIVGASALVRDASRLRPGADPVPLFTDGADVLDDDLDVVVEALGGVEPARTLVTRALELGIPVVTANKSLVAAHGPELRALAARRQTPFLFDAAVLAGVPCLGALTTRPLFASIWTIAGVINGTTHVITTAIEKGESFRSALEYATKRGYAEPDSDADVTGQDAAEKLVVLLQLAGCAGATTTAIPRLGIAGLTPAHFDAARRYGGTIKPVALASLAHEGGGAWVGPAFVPGDHPLAAISGVTNALQVSGPRGRDALFVGPGAGPDITAATILDDVVECTRRRGGGDRPNWRAQHAGIIPALAQPPTLPWFICGRAGDHGSDLGDVLAAHGVTPTHVARERGRISILTGPLAGALAQTIASPLRARGALVVPALTEGQRT